MNLLLIVLSMLLGWLVGGITNWMADELPRWHQPEFQRFVWRKNQLAHYFTLGWRPLHGELCPHCGQARSWRAPLLEAAVIALFVLAAIFYGDHPGRMLLLWIYSSFLLAVMVIDYEHRRVLNVMLLPAYPLAFLFSFGLPPPDPLQALLGGLVGFVFFLLLAIIGRGALGMGDVKLAVLIGVMTGYPSVLSALILSILLAGLAAIFLLVRRQADGKSTMAYAPYMAVGALIVLWRMFGNG